MGEIRVGRPTKSNIRQNIVEILSTINNAYGYDIFKNYNKIFPPVHMRSIYYHLKKGIETGEFVTHKISKESGDFSLETVLRKSITLSVQTQKQKAMRELRG